MNIAAAIKREERKLEKQLGKLQHQLDGVRAAANVKKRELPAAARAKISRATKKRWAKFRKEAKKVTG